MTQTIIPQLLQPLAFAPTPHSAAHIRANLSALIAVLQAVEPTGRAPRWRGVILDYTSRLWVGLVERQKEDAAFGSESSADGAGQAVSSWIMELKELVVQVVNVLARQCPSVGDVSRVPSIDQCKGGRADLAQVELAELVRIDTKVFSPLVAAL